MSDNTSQEDNPELDAIGFDLPGDGSRSGSGAGMADDKARKESAAFESDSKNKTDYAKVNDNDLDDQNKEHKYVLRKTFNQIFVWAIRIAGMALILLFLVRIWHIAGPVACQWMTDDAVRELDKIFLGGALGGFLTRHLEKVISPS